MPPHPNPRKKYKSTQNNTKAVYLIQIKNVSVFKNLICKLKFSVNKSLNGSEMSDKKVKIFFVHIYFYKKCIKI